MTDLTQEQIESNAKLARWLLWMENGKIDYAMSHHQFNDDRNYDLFLTAFKLEHLKKQYRTKGRNENIFSAQLLGIAEHATGFCKINVNIFFRKIILFLLEH